MARLKDTNSGKVKKLTRELTEWRTRDREGEQKREAKAGQACGVQCELIEGEIVKEL